MTLANLEYFQAICRHQNITQAAAELHVSQPNLSHVIHELEKEFGLTLFLRRNKGLILTEEGQQFANEASLLLEQAAAFSSRMTQLGKANKTLNVGIPPASGNLFFPDVLHILRERYPQLTLNLMESGSLSNRQAVLDGGLDVAFTSTRSPVSSAFGCHLLSQVGIHCYISMKNPLSQSSSISLEQVGGTPLVLVSNDCFLTSDFFNTCRQSKITPHVILHTNQLSIIRQLVENNTAAAILFGGVLPESDLYAELPIQEIEPARIYLIWNGRSPVTAAKSKFIHVVKEIYP